MKDVIYNNDERYPGPEAHPPPDYIKGIPTQAELDAYPRMFTWGELKGIVKTGQLECLMRNKAMQARYDAWMSGIKAEYGSTEKYLTRARLPWSSSSSSPEPTYDISRAPGTSTVPTEVTPDIAARLTVSTDPVSSTALGWDLASNAATPGRSMPGSGTATPNSAGFVSLATLKQVNGRLKMKSGDSTPGLEGMSGISLNSEGSGESSRHGDGEMEEVQPVYLHYDQERGLDRETYAVLPNDWPYNIPYGVRHFCVWSRVPIAHPVLVDYDPNEWDMIESEGLGGFTGITPLRPYTLLPPPTNSDNPSQNTSSTLKSGIQKVVGNLPDRDWYSADVAYGGAEMKKWAGVEYTSVGGQEVKRMVEGLWDPRGWECIWFVNPPRLQSVPGFSHFHVFARRKTPEEIDACEGM